MKIRIESLGPFSIKVVRIPTVLDFFAVKPKPSGVISSLKEQCHFRTKIACQGGETSMLQIVSQFLVAVGFFCTQLFNLRPTWGILLADSLWK